MTWQHPDTAPINTRVIVYGTGGVRIAYKDELGNWRSQHGGRPKQPPSHWQPMPETPKS